MKKLKFSIITVSIALSFGLFADENGSSLYSKAQTEALNKQENSADERSRLRNKETLTGLKNKNLIAEIESVNKKIELKKLLYALDNVPAEYLEDPEKYYEKLANESKQVDISSLYPDLNESTAGLTQYPQETYDIDQIIAIPEIKRLQQQRVRVRVNDSDVKIISQEELNPSQNQQLVTNQIVDFQEPIAQVIPKDVDSVDLDVLNTVEDQKLDISDIDDDLSGILTEEEQARLAAIYNSEGTDIIDTQPDALEKELEKIEQDSIFSTIETLSIDGVYIFGENKSADLSLSFYVGDGVEGENFDNQFREIKENQVISVKGFKYRIKNISFKEVEIESLEDGELYIASKSLRNID